MSWDALIPFGNVIEGETEDERAARIDNALEAWYYQKPTTQRELAGDVSNVEFHTHVITYCVVDTIGEMYYPPRRIDPYRDLLFLFFRLRPHRGCLEILGTIQGRTLLWDLRGCFTVHDMKRTRHVQLPGPSSPIPESTGELFYFPVASMARVRNVSPVDAAELLATRVEWLLMCYKEKDLKLPFDGGSALEDLTSFTLMDVVMQASEFRKHIQFSGCDADKVRNYFEKTRLAAEKERFFSRFAAFLSENDVLRLMKFNALAEDMIARHELVEGDAVDNQVFLRRFPRMSRPSVFFAVPLEEVPCAIAQQLPLRERGLVHLSYLDVAPWVWNCYEIYVHRRSVFIKRESVSHAPWIQEQARYIFHYVSTVPQKGQGKNSLHGGGGPLENVDKNAGLSLASRDLLACLPPCLQQCARNHFPRNKERLTFVSTLSGAGVSMDSAQDLFRDLNNRHPKGYDKIEARFLVEPVWKRNYSPTSCKTIISYTQKGDTEQIHCPYVSQTKTDNTYANCHHCKTDGKIPDIENMYSPAMYLKYQLTRGKVSSKRKKQKEDGGDEKSCSSGEEEEEEEWSDIRDTGDVACD